MSTKNVKMDKMTQDEVDRMKLTMNASAIPDLDELLMNINEMIDFMEKPAMQHLVKNNMTEFERIVFQKYNQIMPIRIIRLLIEPKTRYDHLDGLIEMFESLNSAKRGEVDILDVHEKFTEKVNEKYVYAKFGGKDKFIEAMEKQKDLTED